MTALHRSATVLRPFCRAPVFPACRLFCTALAPPRLSGGPVQNGQTGWRPTRRGLHRTGEVISEQNSREASHDRTLRAPRMHPAGLLAG